MSNRVFLANKILVWVGLISYPLYLWHWPLVSFAWLIEPQGPPRSVRISIVAVSVALAWLTYEFIEMPILRKKLNRFVPLTLAGCMALIGFGSIALFVGRPAWFGNSYSRVAIKEGDVRSSAFDGYFDTHLFPCTMESAECFQSRRDRPIKLAIIGDDHARGILPGLAEALPGINVAYIGFEDLREMPLINNPIYAPIFSAIVGQPSTASIIIAPLWTMQLDLHEPKERDAFEDALAMTARTLTAAGKKVYLASEVPFFSFPPEVCKYARFGVPGPCEEPANSFYDEMQKVYPVLSAVSRTVDGVKTLDFAKIFCPDESCHMVRNGVLMYFDWQRLNIDGSRYLGKMIVTENPELAD